METTKKDQGGEAGTLRLNHKSLEYWI